MRSRGRRGGLGRCPRRRGTSRGNRSSARSLRHRRMRRLPRPRMPRRTTRSEFRSRRVPRTGDTPAHQSEQPPCRSGTPRRDLAKRPWMSPVLWSEPIVVSSPLSELIETTPISVWPLRTRRRGRWGAQSEGFGFASQGTWICPTRSRHSAGIGAPDSSRRYQSWTWSTLTSRPEIVTMRALRTFAAASAATWFSKIAAYGVWDIHQRTRKYVFRPDIRGRFGFIVGGFLPTGWPVDKNRRGGTIKRFLDGSRN